MGNLQRGKEQIRIANDHRRQDRLNPGEFGGGAAKVGGEAPVLIREGIAPELGIGGRFHGPCLRAWWFRKRTACQQQFGTATQGFRKRPFLLGGEALEPFVKTVWKLNLSFDHMKSSATSK